MPDAILDLLAPADALQTHLAAVADLAGIDVVVDRQKNILSEVAKSVAKAKGAAIVIMLDGWADPPEGEATYLRLRYSVSLWTLPVLRSGAIAEAVALGAMVRAIQGWKPSSTNCSRWHVGGGTAIESKTYHVYEFPAFFEIDIYPEV
jgi:hypothetical protein